MSADDTKREMQSLTRDLVDLDINDLGVEELERRLELAVAAGWLDDCGTNNCSEYSGSGECETNTCSCYGGSKDCTTNGCSSYGCAA